MERKVNQRVLLTKKLIHEALIVLLQEEDIRRISIRELCEKAGINRTTFYNHYGSQYDVLAELTGQYLENIAHTLECAELLAHEQTQERVTLVLQYMLDNRELSRLLINNCIDDTFASRLFSLPKIENLLGTALQGISSPWEKQSRINFAIYGGYKILQDWLNAAEQIPPAQEADLILKLEGTVCTRI